jgi:single-stranded DNA-binding protein
LSDKTYAVAIGVVQQFGDNPVVREREANGKKVYDVAIKTFTAQKILNITIWPEFEIDVSKIKRGDLVWADGEFTSRVYQTQSGEQREGLQISASSLGHLAAVPRAAREVVQQAAVAQSAGSGSSVPF